MLTLRLVPALLCSTILHVLLMVNPAHCCDCEQFRAPLIALFDATGGPQWNNPWDTSAATSVCSWSGLVCDNFAISIINLTARGLTGTLPGRNFTDHIGTQLQRLILGTNRITGTIPPEYGNISNMWNFEVKNNQLHGTLPPELSKLRSTSFNLRVANNNLSGTLSEAFAAWNLETIYLDNNSFSGTLPAAFSRWGTNVYSLKFGSNHFTGTLPPEYSSFTALKELDISFNQFSGSIPVEYGNWSQAQFIRFQSNQLSGTLPPQLGVAWKNVTIVHLFSNKLYGQIPASWSEMVKVEALTFISNNFTGSLPAAFSKLSLARVLSFDNNQLSGSLPDEWSALRPIMLGLQGNPNLRGPIPESWRAMYASSTSPINLVSLCGTGLCSGATLATSLLYPARLSCIPGDALETADNVYAVGFRTLETPAVVLSKCSPSTPAPSIQQTPPPPTKALTATSTTTAANRAATTAGVMLWSTVVTHSVVPAVGGAVSTVRLGALQSAMGALKLRIRCYYSHQTSPQDNLSSSSGGDTSTISSIMEIGGELSDNPTQLSLSGLDDDATGATVFALAGGTVVGNVIIVVATAGILRLFCGGLVPMMLDTCSPQSDAKRGGGGDGSDGGDTTGALAILKWMSLDPERSRVPGTLIATYAALLQPSLTAAVVLIGGGGAPRGAVALGAIGFVLWLSLLLWGAWRLEGYYRWSGNGFPCAAELVHSRLRSVQGKHPQRRSHNATSTSIKHRLWSLFVDPQKRYRWTRAGLAFKAAAASLLATHGPLFEDSARGFRLYFLLDFGTTALSSVIVGIASTDVAAPCLAAQWSGGLLAAVTAVQLAVFVFCRPLSRLGDNVAAGTVTALALISEIISASGSDTSDGSASSAIALTAGIVQLCFFVLSLVATVRFGATATNSADEDKVVGEAKVPTTSNVTEDTFVPPSKKRLQQLAVPSLLAIDSSVPPWPGQDATRSTLRTSQKEELERLVTLICNAKRR